MTAPTGPAPVVSSKPVDAKRNYFWDFSLQPEIVAGDNITSAVINSYGVAGGVPDSTLSIGAPVINQAQKRVYSFIQGGTPGTQTLMECVITTDGAGSGQTSPFPQIAKAWILPVN
jgi:hypothetical protein